MALPAVMTGPIGFGFAFKMIVLNRRLLTRLTTAVLGLFAAWTLGVVLLHDVSEHVLAGSRSNADWWEGFVLIALLPVLGIAHLILLAERPDGRVTAA